MNSENQKIIRVLVVEDSPVIREYLTYVLNSDPAIKVIGTACDGEKALEAISLHRPDVITMDIHMPKMDGFEATRKIMETIPTPIIIVSGSSSVSEVATTFHAMEAGALAVVQRPKGFGHPEHKIMSEELIQTVKLMSEVKVIRRWAKERKKPEIPFIREIRAKKEPGEIQVIGIGASTGGPVVLKTILSGLPKDFPVPILIVQHIASGFVGGFVDWLNQSSNIPIHVAKDKENIIPGNVYVAPDGFHLVITPTNQILLSNDEPVHSLRPSVSYLFRSIANVYGRNSIGVLLTGMGKDGAEELKLMKDIGAITIAQDAESSVVYGMPGEAVKLDAVTYVLSPEEIAPALMTFVKK